MLQPGLSPPLPFTDDRVLTGPARRVRGAGGSQTGLLLWHRTTADVLLNDPGGEHEKTKI